MVSTEFKSLNFASFFFFSSHVTNGVNSAQAGKLTQAPTAKWRSWFSNPRNFKQRSFLHTRGQKANENCEIISARELYKYPAAKNVREKALLRPCWWKLLTVPTLVGPINILCTNSFEPAILPVEIYPRGTTVNYDKTWDPRNVPDV